MSTKYLLIGTLVIASALLLSGFASVTNTGSFGVIQYNTFQNAVIAPPPFPFIFSPFLVVVGPYIDDHYSTISSLYLITAGQYLDKQYSTSSSAFLVVVGKYIDDYYPTSTRSYFLVVGPHQGR
jgi:hypothetical protein